MSREEDTRFRPENTGFFEKSRQRQRHVSEEQKARRGLAEVPSNQRKFRQVPGTGKFRGQHT
jgi:hypothetical protein